MSNEAYLIATDIPGPCVGDIGCDKGSVFVANAPLAVPVYWLSLFDSSHLVMLEVPSEEGPVVIPSLAAAMGDAERLLEARRDVLAIAFPEFRPTWDQFARVVGCLKARYLKIEMSEIWDIDQIEITAPQFPDWQPGGFTARLESALRWFDTGFGEDFLNVLEVASVAGYDAATRTFPPDEGIPRAYNLRGYALEDSWWDNESDL